MARYRLPSTQILTRADKDRIRQEILDNCIRIDDCLVYCGARNPQGYGLKRIGGKVHSVSRFMLAYETLESLNTSFDACHKKECLFKACCNPEHLFWGSHSKNCEQREQAKQEYRELTEWFENNPQPLEFFAILHSRLESLEKQRLTGLSTIKVNHCSVSPFIPTVIDSPVGLGV